MSEETFWNPNECIDAALLNVSEDYADTVREDFTRDAIVHNLALMPPILKHKIYILAARKFWRKYVPNTGKVPCLANTQKTETDRLLWQSTLREHSLPPPALQTSCPKTSSISRGVGGLHCCMAPLVDTKKHPIVYQRIPPESAHERGITMWDEEDEIILNYPGEKINTNFQSSITWRKILKDTKKMVDFSPETKALYASD